VCNRGTKQWGKGGGTLQKQEHVNHGKLTHNGAGKRPLSKKKGPGEETPGGGVSASALTGPTEDSGPKRGEKRIKATEIANSVSTKTVQ